MKSNKDNSNCDHPEDIPNDCFPARDSFSSQSLPRQPLERRSNLGAKIKNGITFKNYGNLNQGPAAETHRNEEARWWKRWWKNLPLFLFVFFLVDMIFVFVVSIYSEVEPNSNLFLYVVNLINKSLSVVVIVFMLRRYFDDDFNLQPSVDGNNDDASSVLKSLTILEESKREDRNNEVARRKPKPPQWKIDTMNAATLFSSFYAVFHIVASLWGIRKSVESYDLWLNIANLIVAILYLNYVTWKIAFIYSTRSRIPIRRQLIFS